jgi:hypothetical protein
MIAKLVELGSSLAAARWISSLRNLAGLASLRDPNGRLAFPTVRAAQDAGTLGGLPVIGTGFGPADQIVLVDGSEIVLADEQLTRIALSDQALVEQDSDPSGAGLQTAVSMFATDSLALKAVRYTNWLMRRPRVTACANFAITATAPPVLT